tara:strand:- start:285 stop:578 length:294 start_codon:yes stop_codon:yes gene_type:complete
VEEIIKNENGTEVSILNKTKLSLKDMQDYVGGYIEVVSLSDGSQMVLDEEGKLKDKPINYEATKRYVGEEYDDTCATWDYDYVVGDVLILKGKARMR